MAKDNIDGGFFDVGFTIKNTAVGFVLTISLLFISSVISVFAVLPEAIVSLLVAAVTYISIGVCGFRAARHLGRSGLLSGALSGLIYVIVLYLIGGIAFGDFGISYSSAITMLICVLCGAIGGVIGINTRSRRRR